MHIGGNVRLQLGDSENKIALKQGSIHLSREITQGGNEERMGRRRDKYSQMDLDELEGETISYESDRAIDDKDGTTYTKI